MAKASKMNFGPGGKMAEEDADEGGGGGKKRLIIIILILLLLGGGGFAAYTLFFPSEEKDAAKTEQAEQDEMEENIAAASQMDASKLTDPKYTPPKKYVVNLRDGRHFLTVEIVAALEDPAALAFLATREPIVDDMIISLLGNLTSDDLRTPSGKELLKREIYKKVNSVFTQEFIDKSKTHDPTPVKKILFTEFLLN